MPEINGSWVIPRVPAWTFAITLLFIVGGGSAAWVHQADSIDALRREVEEHDNALRKDFDNRNATLDASRAAAAARLEQRMAEMQKELDFLACTQSPKSCSDGRLLNR